VVAAVRHLFDRPTEQLMVEFDALPPAEQPLAIGIDLLWANVSVRASEPLLSWRWPR